MSCSGATYSRSCASEEHIVTCVLGGGGKAMGRVGGGRKVDLIRVVTGVGVVVDSWGARRRTGPRPHASLSKHACLRALLRTRSGMEYLMTAQKVLNMKLAGHTSTRRSLSG